MQIEGLSKLKRLRILNLANNLIVKIEGLEGLTELIELNLKINQIENIENINQCTSLNKLFLSQNKINKLPNQLPSSLSELSLDSNPISQFTTGGIAAISSKKLEYAKSVLQICERLKILDGKATDMWREELLKDNYESLAKGDQSKKKPSNNQTPQKAAIQQQKQKQPGAVLEVQGKTSSQPASQPASTGQNYLKTLDEKIPESSFAKTSDQRVENDSSEDVLIIIEKQWQKELKRVQQIELQGNANKKNLIQSSEVEGGHAEIEDVSFQLILSKKDTFLLIFGTAFQIVLPTPNFQDIVDKLHLQYMLFDSLIDQCLPIIKNYKKLREIILKDNYINGLLQIAKLESLPSLRIISIYNNPICNCSFFNQFLVYRFPMLIQINSKDIREADRNKAKQMFQNFDKILQIPEKFYNPENLRNFSKDQEAQAATKKDKLYIKTFSKAINDINEKQLLPVIKQQIDQLEQKQQFEKVWEQYMQTLIIDAKNRAQKNNQ